MIQATPRDATPPAMHPSTAPTDPPVRHVYHLSSMRLMLLPAVWVLMLGLLLLPLLLAPATDASTDSAADAAADHALPLTAALFTLILLPFVAIAWQSRLVLTPQGIAHHQLGYTVRSPWANLVALDLTAGRQALYLAEPGSRSRLLRWSSRAVAAGAPGLADGLIGDPQALAQGRLIFLAPFMQHWRRGPLRDDLKRWAPHLFEPS
jgi:hypothetical protein